MRKKKQLLKQLFSMALTFALLLGFVPGAPVLTARAEETVTDSFVNQETITGGNLFRGCN